MNILVLMKEVPDMRKVKFDRERGVVNRASASAEINPFDLNALSLAAELKEKTKGTVTVLTMGPPSAKASLRDAFARGADQIFLMSDKKFSGADTLATSVTLAAGIQKIGPFDLILCGEKTVDGDTAQVGPEVAEALGIPHACYADALSYFDDSCIEVIIGELCGKGQKRKLALPALLSVTKNISVPKLPTVERKLKSLDVHVGELDFSCISDLVTEDMVGSKGSPTKVKKIEIQQKPERTGTLYKEDFGAFFRSFAEKLEETGIDL